MSETTNPEINLVDDFFSSIWAAMPENTANTIAGIKKDFLNGLKSTIDSMVDQELNCLERHLENARHKRAETHKSTQETTTETPL